MQHIFENYPTQFIIIWCLIMCFIIFTIILFFLIFIHRTTQDNFEKKYKFCLYKIENFLINLIIENETNSSTILNAYKKTIPKKLQENKNFKQQLLSIAINLFDKFEGAAKNSILQIIETLELKKIIYKNIKSNNYIKNLVGLNDIQILQLSDKNINIKSSNKSIINKYNEIVFCNKFNANNDNITYNDWQKSFIFYFLQHSKLKQLPNFSTLLKPNTNIKLQQFTIELIYLFGQIKNTPLLLKKLREIDFDDEKNNLLISALIKACLYFDEIACTDILAKKNDCCNLEINLNIKNVLTNINVA